MQFTEYSAVYVFSASVGKTRYTYFLSGKDTVIYLATMEVNKQENSNKINEIVIANLTTAFKSESLIGMVHQSNNHRVD